MQLFLTGLLFFIAAYILIDLLRKPKEKKNIRIAVYNRKTGTKKIISLDRGFDDDVDKLIKEIDLQQKQGMK